MPSWQAGGPACQQWHQVSATVKDICSVWGLLRLSDGKETWWGAICCSLLATTAASPLLQGAGSLLLQGSCRLPHGV